MSHIRWLITHNHAQYLLRTVTNSCMWGKAKRRSASLSSFFFSFFFASRKNTENTVKIERSQREFSDTRKQVLFLSRDELLDHVWFHSQKDSRGSLNSLYFSNNDFGVVAASRSSAILATKGLTSLRGQRTVEAQQDAGTSPSVFTYAVRVTI